MKKRNVQNITLIIKLLSDFKNWYRNIKQERQWRSAHPASRNIKYRKFHVVQFSTGQKINIWCPGKGLKIKKLEWEKYKYDAPEGTWKKKKKKY